MPEKTEAEVIHTRRASPIVQQLADAFRNVLEHSKVEQNSERTQPEYRRPSTVRT